MVNILSIIRREFHFRRLYFLLKPSHPKFFAIAFNNLLAAGPMPQPHVKTRDIDPYMIYNPISTLRILFFSAVAIDLLIDAPLLEPQVDDDTRISI